MMVHLPINHHLRPLYRILAGVVGLYVLVFGVVGVFSTRGVPFFAQDGLPSVLGLHANPAFAVLSIVVGSLLVGGAVLGGTLDQQLNVVMAFVFLIAGFAMMVVLETGLNFLGFSIATCIVSFVVGLVLLTAGLYGSVGSRDAVRREEAFRHGAGPDPDTSHKLTAPNPPHGQETMA